MFMRLISLVKRIIVQHILAAIEIFHLRGFIFFFLFFLKVTQKKKNCFDKSLHLYIL